MLPPVGIEPRQPLILVSKCQVSVERIVLDFESEGAWVLFPPGVIFCHWIFSRSKASDVNIVIIANFVNYEKLEYISHATNLVISTKSLINKKCY